MFARFARPMVACAMVFGGSVAPLRLLAQTTRGDTAAQLRAQADSLLRRQTPDNATSALGLYRRAAALFQITGDSSREAASLLGVARAYGVLSRSDRRLVDSALVYAQRALPVLRAAGDQPNRARAVNVIANVFALRYQLDSARAYYQQARAAFGELGDKGGHAGALNNLGLNFETTHPDSAFLYFRAALAEFRAIGDRSVIASTLTSIGGLHSRLGNVDSAFASLTAALALHRSSGNRLGEGAALNALGIVHERYLTADSALSFFGEALRVFRAIGDRRGEGATLMNAAISHARRSDTDSALASYHAALSISRRLGDRVGEGQVLTNLGNLYLDFARADSALGRFTEARAVFTSTGDVRSEAAVLRAISSYYYLFGPPDSALHYARQSLAAFRRVGDRIGEAGALNGVALGFRDLARLDSALYYQRLALAANRAIGNRPGEATGLSTVGVLLHALGQCDSALVYLQQGLSGERAMGDPRGQRHALSGLGDLYLTTKTSALRDPVRAVAYFDSAAALHAGIARSTASDANSIAFAETGRTVFSRWSLAWLAQSTEIGPVTSAKGALAAADRGRAQALSDLLRRSGQAGAGPGVPNDGARPGRDLVGEADTYLRVLRRTRSAALSYLVSRDTLISWLLLPSGAVRVRRVPIPTDSLAGLIRAARSGVGVPEAEVAVAARTARAGAQGLLDGFEAAWPEAGDGRSGDRGLGLGAAGTDGATTALVRLASVLLPPDLSAAIPRGVELVIVPHGMLTLVPFAGLPVAPGQPLGIRYALRYAPSLGSLVAAESLNSPLGPGWRRSARLPTVVIGNPSTPSLTLPTGERRGLDPLPGAEREANWVAARLRTTALHTTQATESVVRARLPNAAVVHLATHGFAFGSDARARMSFVALTPDSTSDGLLTVGEIMDDPALHLRAELVVLSACQTGLGFLRQAEGVVGLQRAFLARGARSVLVSLWSVDDQATELLMRRFYTYWLDAPDRPSKAEALRRAQASVRRTPGYEHPRYWAGFQLVGAA